jgi:hypothetical protein
MTQMSLYVIASLPRASNFRQSLLSIR